MKQSQQMNHCTSTIFVLFTFISPYVTCIEIWALSLNASAAVWLSVFEGENNRGKRERQRQKSAPSKPSTTSSNTSVSSNYATELNALTHTHTHTHMNTHLSLSVSPSHTLKLWVPGNHINISVTVNKRPLITHHLNIFKPGRSWCKASLHVKHVKACEYIPYAIITITIKKKIYIYFDDILQPIIHIYIYIIYSLYIYYSSFCTSGVSPILLRSITKCQTIGIIHIIYIIA